MTYNQIVSEIQTILENHNQINQVKLASPTEWLNWDSVPIYPVALYTINDGSYNIGREIVYKINFWFLDKSGVEGEYETEVTSDMLSIATDIINILRFQGNKYGITDNISWTAISEKFEDYISGVNFSLDLSIVNSFSSCDAPMNDLLITEERNILVTEDNNFIAI